MTRVKMYATGVAALSLLICVAFATGSQCNAATAARPDAKPMFGVFTNPQLVMIEGYTQDAMEPFISPDGDYLFFNESNSAPVTNLYYATAVDQTG